MLQNFDSFKTLTNLLQRFRGGTISFNPSDNTKWADFDKVRSIPREDLLAPTTKESNKMFPLALDYNPNLPNIGKSCIHINISFMILPPLQKYSPKGLLFHRIGDLTTFKTFFHTPIKLK